MYKYLILLFLLIAVKVNAQNIQGKIIDESTGTPVPFVSLGFIGTTITSVTNENGEFIIKPSSLPSKLRISHISYQQQEIVLDKVENGLLIKLKPASINLLEVSVDPYAGQKILKNALILASENKSDNHYLNTFYRQLTSINNSPSQIYELFYDLKWNVNKTEAWLAKQSRFAEIKDKQHFTFNNLSSFTFSSSGYLLDSKKGTFIDLKNIDKYNIEIESYIEQKDQDIAVITCKLKKTSKNQFYGNSKYYIGVDDHKIYRLENNIFNLPLTLSGSSNLKYPPIANTVSTFKNNGSSTTVLESVNTKIYISIASLRDDMQVYANSLLTVITEDENLKDQKFNSLNMNVKDKNVIESIKYNADFWRNNPIVKQTALEDKFIKMMESQNAFGTMINP